VFLGSNFRQATGKSHTPYRIFSNGAITGGRLEPLVSYLLEAGHTGTRICREQSRASRHDRNLCGSLELMAEVFAEGIEANGAGDRVRHGECSWALKRTKLASSPRGSRWTKASPVVGFGRLLRLAISSTGRPAEVGRHESSWAIRYRKWRSCCHSRANWLLHLMMRRCSIPRGSATRGLMATPSLLSTTGLVDRRFSLFQIGRIEAFGEPAFTKGRVGRALRRGGPASDRSGRGLA
jgi:hypothetical protein